jgi:enoyl-CoA hydratase/carnithine racemase
MPETRVGLIPDVGGSSRLPAIVGLGRAKELIMTSKLIDGTEAERIGLVNRVAPSDELDAATEQLVGELLACAPTAVGLAKRVLDGVAKPTLAASLEHEVTVQQICAESEDFAEGTRRSPRSASRVQRALEHPAPGRGVAIVCTKGRCTVSVGGRRFTPAAGQGPARQGPRRGQGSR